MIYKVPVKVPGTMVVAVMVSQVGEPELDAKVAPAWPVFVTGGL
jgi:hypothetical protein